MEGSSHATRQPIVVVDLVKQDKEKVKVRDCQAAKSKAQKASEVTAGSMDPYVLWYIFLCTVNWILR